MLSEKVAVITGASRGIGRATAFLFAQNNASVVVNYNQSEDKAQELVDEIKSQSGKAIAVKADVSKKEEVATLFKETVKMYGRVDVLVNNAGVLKDNLMMMTREEDYDNILDTNLKGTYLCMQRAVKVMIRQKSGKIINLSSIVGRFGNSGQTAYCASKAGVIGLTLSSAKELGNFGITVNAVAPGIIDTDMTSELKDEVRERLVEAVALKRIGTPEDVAKVILFLASDLSDYVSGQVIGVDGCQIM